MKKLLLLLVISATLTGCGMSPERMEHERQMAQIKAEQRVAELEVQRKAAAEEAARQKELMEDPLYREKIKIDAAKQEAAAAERAAKAAERTASSTGYLETSRQVHDAIEVGGFLLRLME